MDVVEQLAAAPIRQGPPTVAASPSPRIVASTPAIALRSPEPARVAIRGSINWEEANDPPDEDTTCPSTAPAWRVDELRTAARTQGSAWSLTAICPSARPASGSAHPQAQRDLIPYDEVRISGHRQHRAADRRVLAEPGFRQADGLATDAGVSVADGPLQERSLQGVQAIEGTEPGPGLPAGRDPARPSRTGPATRSARWTSSR